VAWAKAGKARTMRATYSRKLGTEQFLGFLDVHDNVLSGLFRKRKRLVELAEAFGRLRACYGRRPLYVVLDNLRNVHDNPRFLALARRLHITLVFTPTEASWLNLIEPHFGVLKRFTVVGTDDRSHLERRRRIYRYLRWRDRSHGTTGHPLQRLRSIPLNKLERHLDECDRTGRRVGHEGSDAFDVVDERIEVLVSDVEKLHREGAGVDLHVADVLGLPEELAPVARAGQARAHQDRAARSSFGRGAVPRIDLPATEGVKGPVLQEHVDRPAHRRGAGGEDRGGAQAVIGPGEEDQRER
jgi:hypothetical protein